MLRNMGVNLTQLNSETSDLDLIVSTTTTFAVSVRQVSSKISSTVKSVSWALPNLSPWLTLVKFFILGNEFVWGSVPVGDEFLFIELVVLSVTFSKTSSSHVNLTNLTNTTGLGSVVSINN
ncbi:hypothetical protein OGAPHI_004957 [Ogataea philodendri]|uniref:Uncharacterized protein n=1 Tax=Ogataea philodendri TaxID=1378263 RepID=A0A9P8T2D9_9ASCO|nr:uncharacterized protein OGAPHI_004957 [Ogataea philodendri]KAH3663556.1 hypothetical protein OGAPHI_004957 [Ogataea philodendri]